EGAGGHEEHLPRRDREARMLVGVAEHGNQELTPQAVAQLVGIRVPVWLAKPSRLESQSGQRHALQDRKVVAADLRPSAVGSRDLRRGLTQVKDMLAQICCPKRSDRLSSPA